MDGERDILLKFENVLVMTPTISPLSLRTGEPELPWWAGIEYMSFSPSEPAKCPEKSWYHIYVEYPHGRGNIIKLFFRVPGASLRWVWLDGISIRWRTRDKDQTGRLYLPPLDCILSHINRLRRSRAG